MVGGFSLYLGVVREFFDKQQQFIADGLALALDPETGIYRSRYTSIWYGGAMRGGKSVSAVGLAILLCRIYPGSRWGIVRKSLPLLRQNTIPKLYEMYPQERLKRTPAQHNGWSALLANGNGPDSEIIFISEDIKGDPEGYAWRGREFNGYILEEANECAEVTYQRAIERNGTWMMDKTWRVEINGERVQAYPSGIFCTVNPSDNWVKEEIYDKYEAGTLSQRVKYIPSTVWDNPHIPQAWIDMQRDLMPPLRFQQMMEGDWNVTLNNRPFMYEWSDDFVFSGNSDLLMLNDTIIISCDQNIEPPAAGIYQVGQGWVHKVAEADIKQGSVYDVAGWIKERFPGYHYIITGDAAGHKREISQRDLKSFYEILAKELGVGLPAIKAPRSNKGLNHSRDLCNHLFRAASMGKVRFLVHESCKKTIRDMKKARVDATGTLEKSRNKEERYLDSFDETRYLIQTFFPHFVKQPMQYFLPKS